MKSSNYNGILSQIEQVEATKKTISTLTELSAQQPNAYQFIAIAQDKLNKDSQVLNRNLDKMEAECIRLEGNLAEANKVVNEKRAFEAQIKNQVQQTEKTLKEAISKNQELDLKINTSESELANLTQERQTLITDKLNLVSNMNDQQKYFVLTKARANQDITIEGLILNSGFNEQEYLSSQQQEQPDELEDIFAQQLGVNKEIYEECKEVSVQYVDESDKISIVEKHSALEQFLKTPMEHYHLDLSNQNITDEDCFELSSILLKNNIKNIKFLHLNNNQITDAGISALADGLQGNNLITSLYIQNNKIGNIGIIKLSKILKGMKHLSDFGLNDNQIGKEGVSALVEELKGNECPLKLWIANNNLGDEGTIVLARNLKDMNISNLGLAKNNITDVGAKVLIDEISNSGITTNLYLAHNYISPEYVLLMKNELSHLSYTGLNGQISDVKEYHGKEIILFDKDIKALDVKARDVFKIERINESKKH